jgi:hypothetical protein
VRDWWCYRCGVARDVTMCPVCGLKAPSGYSSPPEDNGDDSKERTAAELEGVHSTLKQIQSTLSSLPRFDVSGLFWSIVIIFLLESWPGSSFDRWTDKAWYSVGYGAAFADITLEKRPLDCDFMHAPLGAKGCKYEKRANVFGDEQRQALIRQATSATDKDAAAKQPNAVTMYWEKSDD